jgi:decaprenylphospho-beta-D-ribofuranose 2-oxidase
VTSEDELADLIAGATEASLVPRGLGRSYGDAATNAGGTVIAPFRPSDPISLDTERMTVTATAGTSIERLLRELVPRGLTLPVLPGTCHVTLGGAIAADIHGKNHHGVGSLGRWLDDVRLVDGCGVTHCLSAGRDDEALQATVGGMGLTGVITAATVRLRPAPTSLMSVTTSRCTFDDVLRRLAADPGASYSVAWLDCLAPGRDRYRAVLDEGEHANPDEIPRRELASGNPSRVGRTLTAPRLPISAVRPSTVRAFNEVWWRRARSRRAALVPLDRFFFPLDGVAYWNRLYGPRGFVQYQFVVPLDQDAVLQRVLNRLVRAGAPPSLAVLKRMGPASAGALSFPLPGWTLALDLPAATRLAALLNEIDGWIVSAGGRIYLAKDSRAPAETVLAMYPQLAAWRKVRERFDPDRRFSSDLGRRTGLC